MSTATAMWISFFSTVLSPDTIAFMIGVSRSAFAAAWITKGRYVRFTPSFFALARTAATLCMSTSAKMWTWGEVCLLRTMCSAIFFRIGVHGTTWSPSARAAFGARATFGGVAGRGAGPLPAAAEAA